jgi:AraC family transcriptional regulator of arabinose operon
MNARPRTPSAAESWRRRSFDVQTSDVVASRAVGPAAPPGWAARLRRLNDASRQAVEGPEWWTPVNAYFGSVETRTDPQSYFWDGMKRLGRRDHPLVFFQFTLAGFGHFELYGQAPQPIPPGTAFFAVLPSRHRYYLPESSPGWTFAWLGIYHPYLLRRIAKQVAATGPVLHVGANSPLIARATRLVCGAFHKDFRDRFAVERELFEFTLEFERLMQAVPSPAGERLLDELRERVLADPARPLLLRELARERGLSQSAFSHFFRARTGLTPGHFMTEVRVQQAARLLTTTELTLASIARECGFANANHLGKVFRRFRQQSAGSYRSSVR